MTLVRLALRLGRVGVIAVTAIAAANALGQVLAFGQVAGTTPAERAIFGRQMELLGRQFAYLLPDPTQVDTVAGFVHWRLYGFLPLVYGFWALVAGTGAGRGDEERGLVEHWLAAGVSRWRYVATRALVFALSATLSIAVLQGAAAVGAAISREPLAAEGLVLQGAALLALTLCSYGVALGVAQLAVTRRGALGLGGALLLGLFFLNSAGRVGLVPDALRAISPFWAYERSTPLLRDGALDVGATAALLMVGAALIAFAALAFAWRDVGSPLLRLGSGSGRPTSAPSRDPLLRLPVLALVAQQRASLLAWMAGLAALAVFFIALTRTMVDLLRDTPTLRVFLERAGMLSYESFVGATWLSTALLLLSFFAIAHVAGWAADDAEGRLETILAQPISRDRVVLERLGALIAGAALVVAASALAAYAAVEREAIPLDAARFAGASALLLTVPFAFGGIGAAVVGWRPRVAIGVLTAVAVVSYLVQQFAPLFDWPDAVRDLSLYALYGQPLASDVRWGGIGTLLVIGIGGTAFALGAMRRRDVGR